MPRIFPETEFNARQVRVRKAMEVVGVDILLTCNPARMDYLTGYNIQSFVNTQMVIVDLSDAQSFWIGRPMDVGGALHATYLDQDHVLSYPEDHLDSDVAHPFEWVADFARKKRWDNKRIGLELDDTYFTPRGYSILIAELPDTKIVNVSRLINRIRSVKSNSELRFMREAGKLTDLGMKAAFEVIRPGVQQSHAAGEIVRALIQGNEEFGGSAMGKFPMLPSGEEFSLTYHSSWSDKPYLNNSSTGLEFSGTRFYYSAPLARTIYLGKPPTKLLDTAGIMIEGLEAMIAGLKAGMTGEEGELLWRNIAIKKGVDKKARIGYSVGLFYPPGWTEGAVSLRPGDKTILQENMTIHLIPSIMGDGWGLEISETVVIGASSSTPLSLTPRDLVIID